MKYPNLRAEMARRGLGTVDLAKLLGITESSARNKLSGRTPFTVDEVKSLKESTFPKLTFEYLFSADPSEGGEIN